MDTGMKLLTYRAGGREAVGALAAGGRFAVDLEAAEQRLARGEKRAPVPFFRDMMALLEAGRRGMQAARQVLRDAERRIGDGAGRDPAVLPLSRVRLRAPVPRPRKVLCLAGNYREHIQEGGARLAMQDSETPRVFMKPPSTTVIGSGDRILIPPVARAVDWEGELAVIMGRRAKGVKAAEAVRYIAGYTVMNDVSERKLLVWSRSSDRPQDRWFDWLNGKWFDTFAPQGPWIVTPDEIPDPQSLEISTRVNGERKQHSRTAQMIFSVGQIVEYISAMLTLEPGDVLSTGTVAGVGAASGSYLKPGDRVEVEISSIGVLRNTVAAGAGCTGLRPVVA